MWFMQRLEPESVAYNLQTSAPFTGPLDQDALSRALSEVVRRHEILRTTFPEVDGQPIQRIWLPPDLDAAAGAVREGYVVQPMPVDEVVEDPAVAPPA